MGFRIHSGLPATLMLVASTTALAGESQGIAAQRELEGSLTTMHERLASSRRSPQDVVGGAQRLVDGYRGLQPAARRFSAADQAQNRRIARQSFTWLWQAQRLYGRDRVVGAKLLQAYGAIGGFYRDFGTFYPAGAFTAFGGANRVARGLVLNGGGSEYERELERYALAYATAAYAYGPFFDWWSQPTGAQEPSRLAPGKPLPAPRPVELPTVDASQLTADQKAQWNEAQDRFRPVSARVHEARLRMNELTVRLQGQGLTLNVQDAATAAKMQGFLEDAVELIKGQEFAPAIEALTRADYERGKLKNVIGQ